MAIDISAVKRLRWLARAIGGGAFALSLILTSAEIGFAWIWIVAAVGVAVFVDGAAFYLLCVWKAPGLAQFVLEDQTRVEGDTVVTETTYAETGREDLDRHIRAYANARSVAMAAASLLLLIVVALLVVAFTE